MKFWLEVIKYDSSFQVVSGTISRDLEEINTKVKDSSMALRKERVRLIKIKVGKEMNC